MMVLNFIRYQTYSTISRRVTIFPERALVPSFLSLSMALDLLLPKLKNNMIKLVAICIAVLIAATKAVDESSTKMTRELKVAAQVVANDLDNLVIPLTSDAAEDEGTSVSKKAALRGAFASPDEDEVRFSDAWLVGLDEDEVGTKPDPNEVGIAFPSGMYKIHQGGYYYNWYAYSSNDCKNVFWKYVGSSETSNEMKYKWYFVPRGDIGFIMSAACLPKVMDVSQHKCNIGQSVGLHPMKDFENNRNQKWHASEHVKTLTGSASDYSFTSNMKYCNKCLSRKYNEDRTEIRKLDYTVGYQKFKLTPTKP